MDSRLSLLTEFGFNRDVFAKGEVVLETTDMQRTGRLVSMAVDSRAMVAIIGPRGHGKTEAIENALAAKKNVIEVCVLSGEKEDVRIGDIERAMILTMDEHNEKKEGVRRTREVRARQLRRMVGEMAKSQKMNIVLRLEEAHRIHGQTLRSLKTLRELSWMGMSPLFTVIMVGQWDPMKNNPGTDEVRLRSDKIEMKGLTSSEVKRYIEETVGSAFEDDAVEAVSRLEKFQSLSNPHGNARNFLELQELLCDVMEAALRHGHKKVKVIDVFSETGGGLKEIRKASGLSQTEMADKIGVSKTELSLLENEKPSSITKEREIKTRNAVLSVVAKSLGEKSIAEEAKAGAA